MRRLSGVSGCCLALAALMAAGFWGANGADAAWAGNAPATQDAKASPQTPGLDDAGKADAAGGQAQGAANSSSKENAEDDGFLSAGTSEAQRGIAGLAETSTPQGQRSDSPVERYLLIAFAGGTLGLTLVAAGIAQWWRRRSIKQYWLFPAAGEDGEPAADGAALPPPLIAKKPMEILPEEKIDKPAHRRAA